MSDNKLVKTILEAATLTGIAAGIGWIAKKVAKENFNPDPSSNVTMPNSRLSWLAASQLNSILKTRRFFLIRFEKSNFL